MIILFKNKFLHVLLKTAKGRIFNILLTLCSLSLIINIFIFSKNFDQKTIRTIKDILSYASVYTLQICFFLLITFIILSRDYIIRIYKEIPKKIKILISLVTLNSFVLAYFVAPYSNRLYFDEHIYQSIGKSISYQGKAVFANYADLQNQDFTIREYEFNKEPNGFPFYLSIFFKIFGANETTANNANILAFSLSIIGIFLVGYFSTGSYSTGLFAGFIYSTIPISVLWSNTSSSEICTAFFAILGMLATVILSKWQTARNYIITLLTLVVALNFRPESFLIVIPCFLFLILNNSNIIKNNCVVLAITYLILLTLPLTIHLLLVRNEPWGSSGSKFAISHFFDNIKINLPFYFTNKSFPLLYSLFAIYGLFTKQHCKFTLPLAIWFLLFWGIFLFFYAGSYEYGSDVRFSILSYAPLAILGGIGISKIIDLMISTLNVESKNAYIATIVFLIINALCFVPLMRTIDNKSYVARNDLNFINSIIDTVPRDSIVLSHVPSIWFMKERSSALLSTLKGNINRVKNDFPKIFNGGVYLHFGSWCVFNNPTQKEFCDFALASLPLKLVKESSYGDKTYKLYKYEPEKEELDSHAPVRVS